MTLAFDPNDLTLKPLWIETQDTFLAEQGQLLHLFHNMPYETSELGSARAAWPQLWHCNTSRSVWYKPPLCLHTLMRRCTADEKSRQTEMTRNRCVRRAGKVHTLKQFKRNVQLLTHVMWLKVFLCPTLVRQPCPLYTLTHRSILQLPQRPVHTERVKVCVWGSLCEALNI